MRTLMLFVVCFIAWVACIVVLLINTIGPPHWRWIGPEDKEARQTLITFFLLTTAGTLALWRTF